MGENKLDRFEKLVSVEYPDPKNYQFLTIIKEKDPIKGERTTMLNRTKNKIIMENHYSLELLKGINH